MTPRTNLETDFAIDSHHKSFIQKKEISNIIFPRPIEENGVVNSVLEQRDSRARPFPNGRIGTRRESF
jgi:hypothetical protein